MTPRQERLWRQKMARAWLEGNIKGEQEGRRKAWAEARMAFQQYQEALKLLEG